MNEIRPVHQSDQSNIANVVKNKDKYQEKIKKGIINKMFTLLGIFIVVAYTVFSFLKVNFGGQLNPIELSLTIIVLWLCINFMYNNSYSAGKKSGMKDADYTAAVSRHTVSKDSVSKTKKTNKLLEFCKFKKDTELRAARDAELEKIGIDYKDYEKKYLGKTKKEIKAIPDEELSQYQKKYIIAANKIKPINLYPDMFYFTGIGGRGKRKLLGTNPNIKEKSDRISEGIKTGLTVLFIGAVTLELIVEPTWAALGEYLLRMIPLGIAAVSGYTRGFENKAVAAVSYFNDAADLNDEFCIWVNGGYKSEEDADGLEDNKEPGTDDNKSDEIPPQTENLKQEEKPPLQPVKEEKPQEPVKIIENNAEIKDNKKDVSNK